MLLNTFEKRTYTEINKGVIFDEINASMILLYVSVILYGGNAVKLTKH